jgi:hypothetical protein
VHSLPGGVLLADSFHVSRLNTNTGKLTTAMFEAAVRRLLDQLSWPATFNRAATDTSPATPDSEPPTGEPSKREANA